MTGLKETLRRKCKRRETLPRLEEEEVDQEGKKD